MAKLSRVKPTTLALNAVVDLNTVNDHDDGTVVAFDALNLGRGELAIGQTRLELAPDCQMLVIQMSGEPVDSVSQR